MKHISILSSMLLAGTTALGAVDVPKHGVVMELWQNIKGGKVADLMSVCDKRPANAVYIRETIDEDASGKDNFGIRFSAWLTPPETGEYTFYLAADDTAELLLSADEQGADLQKVCEVMRHKARHQFGPWQGCGKMRLQKGKKYYLVLHHKEGSGGDHVGLAWEGPGVPKGILAKKYLTPRLEAKVKPIYERTAEAEQKGRELVSELLKKDSAELMPWLQKLSGKDRNLLDETLQKEQSRIAALSGGKYQKAMRRYVKAAEGVQASPEAPVQHPVARRLLFMEAAWLKTLSHEELLKLGAHRLAASLGAIPSDAKTVKATVKLSSHAEKTMDEQVSVGFYAAPGKPVKVIIPEELVGKRLEMRVGHHMAEKNKPLVCMPDTTRWFKLDKPETTFVTPHGGLMMLKVPRSVELADTPVRIEGALKAPQFVLGKHTDADWAKRKNAPGPWGELVCEHIVLVVPRATLQELTNPEALMTWWNENTRDMEDFYSYYPKVPFRMHSGYYAEQGLSYWPLQWAPESMKHLLTLSAMKEKNAALFLHEHGHHCDCWEMELSFWGESTPNWGGYYLKARKGKEFTWKDKHDVHIRRIFDPNDKGMLEIMQDKWYKISGKGTHHWSHPITSMMIGYTDTFGWDCMKKTIKRLRNKEGDMYKWDFVQGADADQAKIDRYLIGLSEAAKRDVRPYFAHFKLFPSDGAAQYLDEKKLPEWDLTYLQLPESCTTKADTALEIPCAKEQLLSFAKRSRVKWTPVTAKGGTVAFKGGVATYTPKAGFKGVDTLTYEISNQYGKPVVKTVDITVE